MFLSEAHWAINIILFLLYTITITSLIIVILMENRNPLKTIPWVLVLLLAPGIGIIFYFFFGQDNRKQKVISRRTYKRIMRNPLEQELPQDHCSAPEGYQPLVTLLHKSNKAALLHGSKITIYTNGKDKFKALEEEILKAKHHIHIQYYIFNDDCIGNRFKNLLIAKAKEGVSVRVLYDDVGSWKVKSDFFKEMKDAGIEVYSFLKVVFPLLTSKVNYRNHRKIVIIDGEVGFIGGMNIADRYKDGVKWGVWRDSHFKIIGKGVYGLQAAFLIDWYVVSKKILNNKSFYPQTPIYDKDNMLQIVTSGPIGRWRTLLQAMIFIIANAKKYIYIQTPYFLPTEGINMALQTAALSGVDVRLMLPYKSDTPTVNWATHSFLDTMVKAGVKIYFYKKGFLHAKTTISDDIISCIGSANMDFRSFEHNFEINALVYQSSFTIKMKKIFEEDMLSCEQLIPERWLNRPIKQRMLESFMRLFSPLL